MEYKRSLIGFLEDICHLFEKEKIPFCVTGGFAASIWGTPRATSDVDIVLNIEGESRERIIKLLDDNFNLVQSHREDMVFNDLHIWRHIIKAEDSPELLILDTLVANNDYLKRVIERKTEINFHNIKLPLVSKEDLVILKTISFRDIDKHDIRNILKSSTPTDWEYLERNFKALQLNWEFVESYKR
jgi:hypothetical protein